MGLGGWTKAGTWPLLCDGMVELLDVELRLLFSDDNETLLPVLTPLLLFCEASTLGAEVLSPRFDNGIAGLMKRSLRRLCKCKECSGLRKAFNCYSPAADHKHSSASATTDDCSTDYAEPASWSFACEPFQRSHWRFAPPPFPETTPTRTSGDKAPRDARPPAGVFAAVACSPHECGALPEQSVGSSRGSRARQRPDYCATCRPPNAVSGCVMWVRTPRRRWRSVEFAFGWSAPSPRPADRDESAASAFRPRAYPFASTIYWLAPPAPAPKCFPARPSRDAAARGSSAWPKSPLRASQSCASAYWLNTPAPARGSAPACISPVATGQACATSRWWGIPLRARSGGRAFPSLSWALGSSSGACWKCILLLAPPWLATKEKKKKRHVMIRENCDWLTMLTDACRNVLFSSCSCFTRILYVSSSTRSTLFCWFKLSMRFCSCSRLMGDGGAIELFIAWPSRELSDSDCEHGELSMASGNFLGFLRGDKIDRTGDKECN